MRHEDIRDCLEFVSAHPKIAPRYNGALHELGKAWARLIHNDAANLLLFEELAGLKARVWGIAGAVFVNDAFIRELKTPPFFWIGPELARRINSVDSPVLSDKQIRDANSSDGLNILTIEGHIGAENPQWVETYYAGVAAFFEEYRGFRIKELIGSQADSAEFLQSMLKSGVMLLSVDGCSWTDTLPADAERFTVEPHVIGLTRQVAASKPGGWFSSVFDYRLPQFGLARRQQQLLKSALRAHTDEQLAEELGISLSAIKKMWIDIYERVGSRKPELAVDVADAGRVGATRGREKRRQLLSYLREHPEELRPFSKKLLEGSHGIRRKLISFRRR
jgi:hypothetical protein